MNGTRYAQALEDNYDTSTSDAEVRTGAGIKSPVKVIADHQYRSLYPLLYATSDGTVLGQGSSADWLSISTYSCPNPTGNDLAVSTPIFTPQQWDSMGLPIDGSPNPAIFSVDVQNIDLSPGNSIAVGIKGKAHRRLAFINRIPVGRGIKVTPYAFYDYKDPPKDSKYVYTPPQGKNAPGTTFKATGKLDDVVNRPMFESYLGLGLGWDTEDEEGFTPQAVQIPLDYSNFTAEGDPKPLPSGIKRTERWVDSKGNEHLSAVAVKLATYDDSTSVPGASIPGASVPGGSAYLL